MATDPAAGELPLLTLTLTLTPNPNPNPNPTPTPTPNQVSEELVALLLGLLARTPTQRLRVKDVRRSELLTRYGEMPPSTVMEPGELAQEELRGAISSVVARLRACPQAEAG